MSIHLKGCCAYLFNNKTKERKVIMKKISVLFSFLILLSGSCAADPNIKLKAPNMDRPTTIMKALAERKSTREYAAKELSLADLSDLLWAANGINRPANGKRTAPSAMNRQDVSIYVVLEKGVYLYNAQENLLEWIVAGDHREAVAGGQDFAKEAPVSLVLVTDLALLGDPANERIQAMGAADVGIVSQNISLFCAAANLATVPRGSMDFEKLRQVLKLKESQQPILNHPVGYFSF